ENLAPVRGAPAFQLVRDTVENEQTVGTLMAWCDAVFHLAAAVGVQLVLDAANRFMRPVLITSSSEVYGKGAKVPFHEDDDVVMGPTRTTRYCYAYCKAIDEYLVLAYHKQYG